MNNTLKIILAQFSHIKPNDKLFNKYLSNEFKKQKIDMVVLGDYVTNLFFKEYKNTKSLQKLSAQIEEYFLTLSKKYNSIFITPYISVTNSKVFKSILIANNDKSTTYQPTKLMNMEHWNEQAFFNNKITNRINLKIFNINGFKTSIISGWESHFDEYWIELKKKNVDVVIIPTASTFNSQNRWGKLLQTRSFLNNCYVVRINKVGQYIENNLAWEFYGNSFIALPDGNSGDILGQKEGILVSELKKSVIEYEINNWHFR